MKKELEALINEIEDIWIEEEDTFLGSLPQIIKLREALATPTAEEVCKALSDEFGYEWSFTKGKKRFTSAKGKYVYIDYYTHLVIFQIDLPPYLITLIGRFLEGVISND